MVFLGCPAREITGVEAHLPEFMPRLWLLLGRLIFKDRAAQLTSRGALRREGTKKKRLLPCHTSVALGRLCNGVILKHTPQAHTLTLCSQLAVVLFWGGCGTSRMRLMEVDH